MSTPTIVVTGFQPFGGQSINPALEIVRALPDQIGDAHIEKVEVPVVYQQAMEPVAAAIQAFEPAAVICVGQAAGYACLAVERVAINVDDCPDPDNAGSVRCDVPVNPEGPAAYFATLPVRDMVRAIEAAGFPARISDSAGTYVCNHLMYSVLDHAARQRPSMLAGFVHVPLLHEQAMAGQMRGKPSMSKGDMTAALAAAVGAVAAAV